MSRYSSDSDSSSTHRRNRSSRRSSSSSSSSSSHRHKSKKSSKSSSSRYKKSSLKSTSSRNRKRSRSRSTSRYSRSQSKDRRKRSYSRDKYKNKHLHKSRSHSKGHSSRYYSRSSSNDSKHSRSRSKSLVHSPKQSVGQVPVNSEDQLREKLLKAIKAAESADHQLKQQGVLAKGVKSRNDITNLTSKPQCDVIKDIESDDFVQRSFTSSKNKKNDDIIGNLAIDLVEGADANSIFHASLFIDPKIRVERWVKKLYQIRQRAISGEPLSSQ